MSPKRVIVSCCYSEARGKYYAKYADRLEESLDKFSPGVPRIIWRESWPPESPSHNKLHYAFKYYAVADAVRRGFQHVMWLDAGSCALAPIDPLWERIAHNGYALLSGDDCLAAWISDQALAHFGVTRDYAAGLKLAGGCLVGLDVEHPLGKHFLQWWGELARTTSLFMGHHTEQENQNGVMRSILRSDADNAVISTDPRCKGHRSDEACFSLMMDRLGMTGLSIAEWQTMMKTY